MSTIRIPTPYAHRPADWSHIVHEVARATYDNPRVVADRLTRYVELHVERYGRAPDMRAFRREQVGEMRPRLRAVA